MLNQTLSGKVMKGETVGRTIGFPTANLHLTKKPGIKRGVYAALITWEKENYLGLAYYGPRFILGQITDSFEVYIFNFQQEIYEELIKVKLLKFLRRPKQVKNLPALKKLLQSDLEKLKNEVVLVNSQDKILGIETKTKSHLGKGKLHRAISVQLFNQKGELLIQQRAKNKPLFAGYWANTVCTDVRPDETYAQAAQRRLKEEFGLKVKLKSVFKFTYTAAWGQNRAEKEIDQVFVGIVKGKPQPNQREISAWQYISLDQLEKTTLKLAPWFKLILKKLRTSDIFKP